MKHILLFSQAPIFYSFPFARDQDFSFFQVGIFTNLISDPMVFKLFIGVQTMILSSLENNSQSVKQTIDYRPLF